MNDGVAVSFMARVLRAVAFRAISNWSRIWPLFAEMGPSGSPLGDGGPTRWGKGLVSPALLSAASVEIGK